VLDAGHHGRRLAAVAAELDHLDPRVGGGERGATGESLILAAIVDEKDLEGETERCQRRDDPLVERPDAFLLVERGHDHRQLGRPALARRLLSPRLRSSGQAASATLLRSGSRPACFDRIPELPPSAGR
jgi:hypothetical protein